MFVKNNHALYNIPTCVYILVVHSYFTFTNTPIDIIDITDIITDIYLEHEAHVADDHPLAEVVVQRLLLTSGFV